MEHKGKTDDTYLRCLDQLLRYQEGHGLHHTPERDTILKVIIEHAVPFSPKELVTWLEGMHISRATVYNTLDLLVSAHILHCLRQQMNTKQVQYELALAHTNYIQMICTRCGRTVELRDAAIRNVVENRRYSNFIEQHFSLYVYGVCKVCRRIKS